MPEIVLPNGQPAKTDVRPKAIRCGICGCRPQLPPEFNPRNLQEAGQPAAGDEVGGIFLILAMCTECFQGVQAVLRHSLGILRPETDLAPMQRMLGPGAPVDASPKEATPTPVA
jgi:hypothetical protein